METELKSERLQIVVEPIVLDLIDDYRFDRRIGSRSEAVRQLIAKGLDAEAKQGEAA